MIISAGELENYTGKRIENPNGLQIYAESASDIISNYLGYNPEIAFHTEYINGYNSRKIQLKHKPVNLVYRITDYETDEILFEAKQLLTQNDYITSDEFVSFKNIIFPGHRLIAEYISGWGSIDFSDSTIGGGGAGTAGWGVTYDCGSAASEYGFNTVSGGGAMSIGFIEITIPPIFKQTALRIAALLLTEADQNIGVTGKSFGDSGSRTFINYTNFDKYLSPLSKYKLVVI
jgi:hypothetical protein